MMRRSSSHYVPILKGRLGELNALNRVDKAMAAKYTPLVEFVAAGDEIFDDSGEPTRARVEQSVMKSLERFEKYWPVAENVFIDMHNLPTFEGYAPIVNVIESFPQEQVIPVLRPSDANDRPLVKELRGTLNTYGKEELCIRLADEDLEERDEPISLHIDRLLDTFAVEPETVHLVVDFGYISEESAAFAGRIARLVIMELPHLNRWKSLTLAAGGFPSNLDSVHPGTFAPLPRREVALWRTVKDRLPKNMRIPGFGDYAIAYPKQQAGVAFAPAPQIRYTAPDDWLVMKGRKSDRRGNAQFYDISRQLTKHPNFTPDLSWGDREIQLKAQFAGFDPPPPGAGPGNAMIWRALGTSHHIAFVSQRLTIEGGP
jgi:hypothetical protein